MNEPIHLSIDALFETKSTAIARDLKLNLKKLLEDGELEPVEATLAMLALASAVNYPELAGAAKGMLPQFDLSADQIREASESAAIMGMLNTYYSFRHKISQGEENPSEDYQTAGLRMTSLSKPSLGKERFEMLAFAVSVLNGCETCVRSHEKSLKHLNVSGKKIHDLAKLAAVIKGLKALGHHD
jgi:alkyl hydroperoxide reductase subunit D